MEKIWHSFMTLFRKVIKELTGLMKSPELLS